MKTKPLTTLFCIILLSISQQTFAETGTLLNIEQSLEVQLEQVRSQAQEFASQRIEQMVNKTGPLNNRQKQMTEAALKKYTDSITNLSSATELSHIWQQAFNLNFTDQELLEVIKFYRSPMGKKVAKAAASASVVLQNEMQRILTPKYIEFSQEFSAELDKVITCCPDTTNENHQ